MPIVLTGLLAGLVAVGLVALAVTAAPRWTWLARATARTPFGRRRAARALERLLVGDPRQAEAMLSALGPQGSALVRQLRTLPLADRRRLLAAVARGDIPTSGDLGRAGRRGAARAGARERAGGPHRRRLSPRRRPPGVGTAGRGSS